MSRDVPLGTFEEQVMVGVLRTGAEAYGMEVRREIQDVTGREISIGSIYATLDRLEAKGLLSSSRSDSDQSRRIFAVTGAGEAALVASRRMREKLWNGVELGGWTPSPGQAF